MPLNVDSISINGNPVKPYKVYTALLTQSGTDAPVATVLENTLGVNVTYSYDSEGIYIVIAQNSFPLDKTFAIIGNNAEASNLPSNLVQLPYESNPDAGNVLYIQTAGVEFAPNYLTNNGLRNTPIEIRVYN